MKADGTCETREERVTVILAHGLTSREAAAQIAMRDEEIELLREKLARTQDSHADYFNEVARLRGLLESILQLSYGIPGDLRDEARAALSHHESRQNGAMQADQPESDQ